MKNLSTVLFVALVFVVGSKVDIRPNTKSVKLIEIESHIENEAYLNELSGTSKFDFGQVKLDEVKLFIENQDYVDELQDATFENKITLDEIPLQIENDQYMQELRNAKM